MEKALFFKIWQFNITTFQFSCRVEQITAIKLWSVFSSQLLSYPVMLKIIYLQVRGVLSNVVSQTLTRFGRYITRTCLIICVKIIMSVRYGCRLSQKTHRVEYESFNALLWLEITFFKNTFRFLFQILEKYETSVQTYLFPKTRTRVRKNRWK